MHAARRTWKVFWQRRSVWWLWLVIVVFMVLLFLRLKSASIFGDEGYHLDQIRTFLRGELRVTDSLTTIPGYHLLLAGIGWVFGVDSLASFRAVTLVIACIASAVVLLLLQYLVPTRRAARFTAVRLPPILLPYSFLLYTDVPSLALLLLATLCFCRKRYDWMLVLAGLSILVRQNNILWMWFFAAVWWLETYPAPHIGLSAASRFLIMVRRPDVRYHLLLLAAVTLLTALFVWRNGGMAIGDKTSHPFPSVHLGNLFFLLMLYPVMFLPLVLRQLPSMLRLLRGHAWVMPLLVAIFTVYMLTFSNSHWYNHGVDSPFLRNRILETIGASLFHRLAFSLPLLAACLSVLVTPLRRSWWLLYPFTIAFLIPSWLIEQRYYFFPFILFMFARKPDTARTEWTLALYELGLSVAVMVLVISRKIFL